MGKFRSRPRMRIRNRKIRCFVDDCKVLAVRFVDVQPRMWYCADHYNKFSLAHVAIEKDGLGVPSLESNTNVGETE